MRAVRRALFALAAGLLVVAALDPPLGTGGPRARAVAVDVSESATRRDGWQWSDAVEAGSKGLRAGDRRCVLAFAGKARVVEGLGALGATPAEPLPGELDAGATDLAAAAAAAREALGAESGEIVLVTDRRATRGGAPQASAGAAIAAVEAPGKARPNAAIASIRAPAEAPPGASVRVRVDVAATEPSAFPAEVELRANGRESRVPVRELAPGRRGADATFAMPADADLVVDARLLPGDGIPEDDAAQTVVVRGGALRVGLIGGGDAFAASLRARGELRVETLQPTALAARSRDLQVLVLVDQDRETLGPAIRDVLEFVRSGGGLLVAGGERSYARGAFEGTDLAAWLPLEPAVPTGAREDLLLLVDTSGSMAGAKLAAARRAAQVLAARAPRDARVRCALFAAGPLEPFDLRDSSALTRLERAEGRGATDIARALREGAASFGSDPGRRRILIVSDGLERGGRSPLEDARAAGEALAAARVECVAFAVGADADSAFLDALTLGGRNGRALRVEDAERLRDAVGSELARDALDRGGPVVTLHPESVDVDLAECPPVAGVARVRARPDVAVLASVEGERPLLAVRPGARVASLAVAPGSELAPAYADLPALFVPLLSALARPASTTRAWLEGGEVFLEEAEPGFAGVHTIEQDGASARCLRESPRLFRGPASGLRPGWARLRDALGEPMGGVWLTRATPLEASPLVALVPLPSLDELPPRAGARSRRDAWLVGALASLLLGAFAGVARRAV